MTDVRAARHRSKRRDEESARQPPTSLLKELYFPTQVYYIDLDEAAAVNRYLKKHIRAWRVADPKGIVRSNYFDAGAWHSPVDMHERDEYAGFRDAVTEVVQLVYDNLGYDPAWRAACDNMWANISTRGAFNRHHTHPGALWSGVYYVQAPEHCGRIFFTDPRAQANVIRPRYAQAESANRARETWSEVYYRPIEGRLMLFPAWLGHEVEPNLSQQKGRAGERISISFNYFQERPRQAV